MKCVVCEKVKGKRFCPAKKGQICPTCCGEKRVLEIACPEDCQYLSSGLSYQLLKKRVGALQHEEDPLLRRKYYDVHANYPEIMSGLEEAIIRFARGLRSLRDEQVRESVALLLKTYQTEQHGLIYEHTATDPIVNTLGRDVKTFLEEHRELKQNQRFLKTGEIVNCLEVLLADIDYHIVASDQESYLRFIARSRPDLAKSTSPSLLV
ncbi:MAG: hypothetical protein EHM61_04120 [Acidobacteria bacterium]|nr:MAG: hypothetical protein EHM61_04120 [Acidobacteriota bacterium]